MNGDNKRAETNVSTVNLGYSAHTHTHTHTHCQCLVQSSRVQVTWAVNLSTGTVQRSHSSECCSMNMAFIVK